MLLKLPNGLTKLAINLPVAVVLATGICILGTPLMAQTGATPSTDGVASASERVDAPVAPPVSSVLPDRPMAITGEPVMMPPSAFANAASEQNSASQTETSGAGTKSSARVRTPKHAR